LVILVGAVVTSSGAVATCVVIVVIVGVVLVGVVFAGVVLVVGTAVSKQYSIWRG